MGIGGPKNHFKHTISYDMVKVEKEKTFVNLFFGGQLFSILDQILHKNISLFVSLLLLQKL